MIEEATTLQPGGDWIVTCTKPSRLIDRPTVAVFVSTELTRVPAVQQAQRKALEQLKALGVRNPEVIEAKPVGKGQATR